jgi:hypothetical protein
VAEVQVEIGDLERLVKDYRQEGLEFLIETCEKDPKLQNALNYIAKKLEDKIDLEKEIREKFSGSFTMTKEGLEVECNLELDYTSKLAQVIMSSGEFNTMVTY